jgi:predicted nucleic acid-binding Zn ribbon protein
LIPIQQFSPGVLAEIVRRQPASAARTAFAWQLAVGPAIARTTTIDLTDGVLRVKARDAHWEQAVHRAADTILARLQHLLGADLVKKIEIVRGRTDARSKSGHAK